MPNLFQTGVRPGALFQRRQSHRPAALHPRRARQDRRESIDLEAQSNPLNICTRPEVLFKGDIDAA
ncbi:major capsid protein [Caulobacter sp. B11]|uniref:major capsid protein n=1 Tax=Caulobacter sp. B11 TaxID=2048899 RepID=UPI000C12DC93